MTASQIFANALRHKRALEEKAEAQMKLIVSDPDQQFELWKVLHQLSIDVYDVGVEAGINGHAANVRKYS